MSIRKAAQRAATGRPNTKPSDTTSEPRSHIAGPSVARNQVLSRLITVATGCKDLQPSRKLVIPSVGNAQQRSPWSMSMTADFSKAARCGAKNRRGTPCRCPAMRNGRCRLLGGLSIGPKTLAGIERIRKAVTKHGRYSARATAERRLFRQLLHESRDLLAGLQSIDP